MTLAACYGDEAPNEDESEDTLGVVVDTPHDDDDDDDGGGGGGGADDDDDDDRDEDEADDLDAVCSVMRRASPDARVVQDVEIACSHTMFGAWGATIVATPDAAILAVSSFYDGWILQVDDSRVAPMRSAPQLAGQRPLLAIDDRGRLSIAGHQADQAVVATFDGEWDLELLALSDEHEVIDLQARGDDEAAMWIRTYDRIERLHRTGGRWEFGEPTWTASSHTARFDLAHDGTELVWEMVEHAPTAAVELITRVGWAKPQSFGAASESLWVPVRTAAPLDPSRAPEIGALSAQIEGLQLEWRNGTQTSAVTLPETTLRTVQCPRSEDSGQCPEDACHERSRGIDGAAFAAARTDDGTTWVAIVESQADHVVEHDETCDTVKGACQCTDAIVDEASTRTLILTAVGGDGGATEALRMPLGAMGSEDPVVDIHANGSMLAIAVTVDRSALGSSGAIRTFLLDTGRASDWAD